MSRRGRDGVDGVGDGLDQPGGFLKPARHQEDRDADRATDQGVAAAGQQHLSDVHLSRSGGDRQSRRGDEHRCEPVVADHQHLDDELQHGQNQRQPQSLRVQPQDASGEGQPDPGAHESLGAAPQRAAAVGALMENQHGGGDRPVGVADAQQRGGGACERGGDSDAHHDVPDVRAGPKRARQQDHGTRSAQRNPVGIAGRHRLGGQLEAGDPAGGVGIVGRRCAARAGRRHGVGEQNVQRVVGGAEVLEAAVHGPIDGLKVDQHVPRPVQCGRRAVPGGLFPR